MQWRCEVTGIDTLTLYFGDRIDVALTEKIHLASEALARNLGPRLIDTVPSYTSLLLRYDLLKDDYSSLIADVTAILDDLPERPEERNEASIIEIPVFYHSSVGPDLAAIAKRADLTIDQVIQRHCQQVYQVFAIGFAPGFAYLGEVAPELAAPRLATPRPKVPAGSLGIADQQTAIYPLESPGGWNLIGRTPLTMFDPHREQPSLLRAGQQVRFRAITRDEFLALGGQIE
ncbi:5-oxoprolinase subunit PxpB [Marinobacter litoralis]|uniref:5-oxoprolinase subunit PxpB n=1 Tax=Marinobacter litoralis TaxID=187981 RepID=UPI0018EA5AF5|nr:5-oxoprolinase subunit PxpB [Marinobacter litoralis]MBJ6136939.1 5-oxoprolinase subunit PxpB [Marinobacter litoralis]